MSDQGDGKVIQLASAGAALRQRIALANSLEKVAGHIRRGELEYPPHGWVLLLHSDQNPEGFEVLNQGIRTKADIENAARAMRHHIQAT